MTVFALEILIKASNCHPSLHPSRMQHFRYKYVERLDLSHHSYFLALSIVSKKFVEVDEVEEHGLLGILHIKLRSKKMLRSV